MKSAVELIASYRAGKADPEAIAEECLALAKERESLGAFLRLDAEQVRRQARAAKERWRKGKAGPLEGVPVSIKDNICEIGERTRPRARP